ncbi:Kelch-like protein 21 [Folsomia candida]|uniref:Kelch-like protein 21 n=1 Tax=Folsomia candida TaxID=158441 RepID=A0A226DIQ6_FOLCA|nr:Kelch-like protein 21 [Folsomia candida]
MDTPPVMTASLSTLVTIYRTGPKIYVNFVLPKSSKRDTVFRLKPMEFHFMRKGKVLSVLTHSFPHTDRLDFTGFASTINISEHYVPTVDKIRLRFFVDVQKEFEVADVDRTSHSDSLHSAEAKHPLTNLKTSLGKFKMFASETQENIEKRVVVKDVGKGVMELMLGYMYCGEVTVLPDLQSLVGLYKAAHKYCMDPLRIWCAYQLAENYLKCDHVLELWSLAKTYEETGLMEETKRFMKA